ncbi:MAG: glycerophosphodiester phosphodiesterase [Ardenticatenaceae bacterium]|nr:glycerophosphodiester phosphodiesterase [Ardenticatenaceae bacterium]
MASENGLVVMAHRGGSGLWPENTMLAFEKAVALGVDALEMDIHSTADGVLVVSHDPDVDRVTNGQGQIHDLALAELKELDAGYWWTADSGQTYPFRGQGITIPTLEEVFRAFPQMWINVDIKQSEPGIVRPFANLIRQYNMTDKMMVGSFDGRTVAEFRRECPQVAAAATENEARLLFGLSKAGLERLYWGRAQAMQLPEYEGRIHVVTPRFVAAAHRVGTAVHVWTVDEVADMQRMIDMGVDGLMTDYPDRLLKLLGRLS